MMTLMAYLREEHRKVVQQLFTQACAQQKAEQAEQCNKLNNQLNTLLTVDGFTQWAETFLALHPPTSVSYTFGGMAVQLGNGAYVQLAPVVPASVVGVVGDGQMQDSTFVPVTTGKSVL